MYPIGYVVPLHDGAWTVVARCFVWGRPQIEVYTLAKGGWEIRLMRSEVERNKVLH